MIIMSEILNKRFDTPEQCLEAEEKYKKQMEAEEALKKEKLSELEMLFVEANKAIIAADEAIEKAANKLFDFRAEHGAGEITVNCDERTVKMVCDTCDKIELKRHIEMLTRDDKDKK